MFVKVIEQLFICFSVRSNFDQFPRFPHPQAAASTIAMQNASVNDVLRKI